MEKILITTPIYYVNDKPHIGHAYTTLAADILTRHFRLQGKEVFFLTGTDEHGAKIAESAEKNNKTPKQFCDENSALFKEAWKNLNIKYNYFIRTTDEKHEQAVKKFIKELKRKSAIYEKEYEGLYCVGCEKFVTEKDLIDGKCPDHKIKPEKISEKNWFFRLENYLQKVEELIKSGQLEIEPAFARSEILGLLKQKLEDFSISRQKERVKWGIDLPFDKNQIIYVWIDALLNYKTGDSSKEFNKFWEEGKVIHLLAKDILKFHAIFWPAMLLAVGEKTPTKEFIHGFFTINGQKMSKSLGNAIDPNNIIEKFGVEATRYLLLSQFPFGQDGDIKEEKFVDKYNSDLANGLGNLVARVLTLVNKFKVSASKGLVKGATDDDDLFDVLDLTNKISKKNIEEFKLFEALESIWRLIGACDKYLEKNTPWMPHVEREREIVLSNALFVISEIADLIAPFLPETSEKIKNQLRTGKSEILFPRIIK